MSKTIIPKNLYKKPYKMRALGEDGLNIVVSMPPIVIKKEAERHGLSISEFIQKFRAIASYNGFEGILYTFKEDNKKDGNDRSNGKQG